MMLLVLGGQHLTTSALKGSLGLSFEGRVYTRNQAQNCWRNGVYSELAYDFAYHVTHPETSMWKLRNWRPVDVNSCALFQ
ncbi:hypothetical protein mRhiFer1_004758 [Rhinolophus ferrumequinum]|uniref:Uncharacterized protein n=1 Tax=Rhinolophus ferrumequinum TaxID=59479 RepID=A0A7J7ZPI7_RHIFE|nr:hypothetical protein mRhiFer1_004758 [Rhinolophus ferrumequinum]